MENKIPSPLRNAIAALILLSSTCLAWSDDLSDARSRANNGEHAEAIRLFERHLQTERPSASVYFELGECAIKSANPAVAALNFRRALILDPRFEAARKALAEANLALGIPPDPVGWKATLASNVPLDAILINGVVLFWGGLFFAVLCFRVRARLMASIFLILSGGTLIVLAWLCDPRVEFLRQICVVSPTGCVVFNAPVDNSEKLTKLAPGSVVTVISERGRWIYGQLPGGARGWFLSEGLESVIPRT
jgi:tetratricopeptide (TPR) repeat protein